MLGAAADAVIVDTAATFAILLAKGVSKQRALPAADLLHKAVPAIVRKAKDDWQQHHERVRKVDEHGDHDAYCKVDSKPEDLLVQEPLCACVHLCVHIHTCYIYVSRAAPP